MPVMATTEKPEQFPRMLSYAIITLISIFVVYANLCYFTWGSNMTEPIVTQMLPADNIVVIIIKFLFTLNLVCSYPIVIQPCNTAVELIYEACFTKDTMLMYWIQNFSRMAVAAVATICAVVLASKLDKFLGLMGSMLCAPLALFFPAVAHLKILAKTKTEKAVDIALIIIAVCIFFFCSTQTILAWNDGDTVVDETVVQGDDPTGEAVLTPTQ